MTQHFSEDYVRQISELFTGIDADHSGSYACMYVRSDIRNFTFAIRRCMSYRASCMCDDKPPTSDRLVLDTPRQLPVECES